MFHEQDRRLSGPLVFCYFLSNFEVSEFPKEKSCVIFHCLLALQNMRYMHMMFRKVFIIFLFFTCANFLEASRVTTGDINIDFSDANSYALAESILNTTSGTQFIDFGDGIKARIFISETTENFIKGHNKKQTSPIEIITAKNKIKIYCFGEFFAEKEISDSKVHLILTEVICSVVDKTPFWGDIPIIGKLFQKKGESRQLFLKWVQLK